MKLIAFAVTFIVCCQLTAQNSIVSQDSYDMSGGNVFSGFLRPSRTFDPDQKLKSTNDLYLSTGAFHLSETAISLLNTRMFKSIYIN